MLYDDEDAIAFIRKNIAPELAAKLSEDDLYYFLDLIAEYYQNSGLVGDYIEEPQEDEDVFVDEEDMSRFIITNAQKDSIGSFTQEEILSIVSAELDYCESIGLMEE